MEAAPVTAATGAIGPVMEKLGTLRRRRSEYQLRRRTRNDVKLIRSKLKSIHSILWVIWERQTDLDAAGKELRMEAWHLADDINDAMDDFILSLKRSNDGKRFMEEDKTQPSPFQDLKRRADDVCERCCKKWKMETSLTTTKTTFSSLFSATKTTVHESGPGNRHHRVVDPYVHKDISELVEMEEPRDTLIKHLVGEEENTPELKMAAILGAAGMGKTTLARLVYEAIEDKFDARAFVSITSCHNMTEVLASILRQVAADDDSTAVLLGGTKAVTGEYLIGIISNFLKDKRYLVIIDDIWNCEEWGTIKKSLPDNNLGSRILTTSRVNAITDKWRDDFDTLAHKIGNSGDWDGSAFTSKMIDRNGNMFGEGFQLGHDIVKMCRGTPLAVACLVSALAKERERREQQGLCLLGTPALQDEILKQVKRIGIQKTPGYQPLVESLELGYNHLPHHMLKNCLLYCSIYPEGHHFYRDDLVRRWIAEGFVCTEKAAKDYFDELVRRGLLFSEFLSDGFCKLHPMMRNYLRWKVRQDNFVTCTSDGAPSSPVGRLCIDYWPSSDAVQPLSRIGWHHIRSLVVLEGAKRVPYERLQHLRVLDVRCRYNQVLENQHLKDMCGLLHLRHLLLCGDGIIEIPADIGRLKYLDTLEVTATKITRLPAEIGDLKQLKTLDVSENREITELPKEIGKLQHLKTLDMSCTGIRELPKEIGKLQHLETLDISGTWISELPKEIGNLQHLVTLDVKGTTGIKELPPEISNLQRLAYLDLSYTQITKMPRDIGKLQHLETLNLTSTNLTELPREISNLKWLVYLNLYGTAITKVPRDIGKLQHLEYLDLGNTKVRKIPREIGGLQNLKYLKDDVGMQPIEAAQLPKLEGLPKCVRQACKNSNLVSSLAGEILSFMAGVDGGLINHTKHMHIPQWIKEHFNNIGFLDIRICKLEEQDLKILREMPNLQWLKLRFDGVPRKPIVIGREGFLVLSSLTVDSRVPRVAFQEGAMPRLELLVLEFQFYGGPSNTVPPMGIKHLGSLRHVQFQCNEWYQGDSPCIRAIIDVVRKEARQHPNNAQFNLFAGGHFWVFESLEIEQGSLGSNEASSSEVNQVEEIQA